MNQTRDCEVRDTRAEAVTEPHEDPAQTLWHWFTVGLLLFCWIAEASMCADRGF